MNLHFGPIHREDHWLRSGDPADMVAFLGERGSVRRWRLFACACCCRILLLLADESSQQAVSVALRVAEGLAEARERLAAREEAKLAILKADQAHGGFRSRRYLYALMAASACLDAPHGAWSHAAEATGRDRRDDERIAQCDLLRDLFGNPFRPVAFDPAWASFAVTSVATHVYERYAWEDLPILGDALEDAGCDDEQVLSHCRDGGEHVRGCWVVDAVLGKI